MPKTPAPTPPTKPTLGANLAAQLGITDAPAAHAPPPTITIHLAAGATLNLTVAPPTPAAD